MDGEAVPEPVSRQFINIFDLLPHEKVESLDPQKFEGSFFHVQLLCLHSPLLLSQTVYVYFVPRLGVNSHRAVPSTTEIAE